MATVSAPNNWQPTRDGLQQVLLLFTDPVPNDSGHHQYVYQQLDILKKHPEFTYYLSYILLYLPNHESDVKQWYPHGGVNHIKDIRCRAGIELKNHLKENWTTIEPATREYVKIAVVSVLPDPDGFFRNIIGTIITTICKRGQLIHWPGILEALCQMLDRSDSLPAQEGAFNALAKICEDMPEELDSQQLGRPLNVLIPKFITFFGHPNKDIRKYAIATVNVFLLTMPHALLINIESYMQNLFALAASGDKNPEIRKRVCQAFVLLLEKEYRLLHPHIEQVIQFMLNASNEEDEVVCLEACEFWSAYCEIPQLDRALLGRYLQYLIPILLKSMRYSPMELAVLGDEDEDDQFVPDRAEDMKPRFHRSQSSGPVATQLYPTSGQITASHDTNEFEDDVPDDFEDDDDMQESEVSNWSLRKCSAAALDTLANVYKGDLLPFLLPAIQEAFNSRSANESEERRLWVTRESGVLALGAIAEGCFEKLKEFLPQLIPHLMATFLTEKKPLIRSITCWTLSRYCKWIINETILSNNPKQYFEPLLLGLLTRLKDKNKKVQETACSAFATLEEEARMLLVPYLKDILETLMFAFQHYQAKNLLFVYDALGTLSEAVHVELNKPELINILIPPLMHKWEVLSDNDRNIFPLLECLTAVSQALGSGFFRYAEPVFLRCAQIIEQTLLEQAASEDRARRKIDTDFPDKEFIVCALDLLSGLAEGLGGNIESLIGKWDKKVLGLLFQCMQDLDPDVRQSAFALLGDLAKTCMGHLRPHLNSFLPICAANLNPTYYSVCNNASWAIGEIAIKAGSGAMAPFVADVMRFLTPILIERDPNEMPALLENASITIGRLSYVCAPQVAPSLELIAQKWLTYLRPLKENQEKEHAFKGLSLVVQQNPMAIYSAQAFPHFAAAIASWQRPSPELANIFKQLLVSYKMSLGAQWPLTFGQCDTQVQRLLIERYQI